MDKANKTEEEWKKELTPEEYSVLRGKATEPPFSGKFLDDKTEAMYKCKACGNELFSSGTKFESGSGWPSFSDAIPGSVEYNEDASYGMKRIEVTCAKCGSHLGHVFDDGPDPNGKRYCINSVCLVQDPKKNENPSSS